MDPELRLRQFRTMLVVVVVMCAHGHTLPQPAESIRWADHEGLVEGAQDLVDMEAFIRDVENTPEERRQP